MLDVRSEQAARAAKLELQLYGECNRKVFGIYPAERLKRQIDKFQPASDGLKLVIDAAAVVSDPTLAWLAANPRHVIRSPDGVSAAVVIDADGELDPAVLTDATAMALHGLAEVGDEGVPLLFNRKLRRRQPALMLSARQQKNRAIEWALFKDVYKGVTDIITRWLWPVPAFWAVRALSRLHVTPNMVTITSILLTIATGLFFANAQFAAGLVCGWIMTFLDTVDGKLARVTCTWSRMGNKLDHIPDLVHPPMWWACLAYGLAAGAEHPDLIWASAGVIMLTYMLGRAVEHTFKKRHGFNQYLWRPFDAGLRFVIARRNTILLFLTLGGITQQMEAALHVAAAWSLITIGLQTVRIVQARMHLRTGGLVTSWMM